jgi:hypothetical protein
MAEFTWFTSMAIPLLFISSKIPAAVSTSPSSAAALILADAKTWETLQTSNASSQTFRTSVFFPIFRKS